jgi:hypothetical protein
MKDCHLTAALERRRDDREEDAFRILNSSIAYIIDQQGRVSEVHHWQSLVRWDIFCYT